MPENRIDKMVVGSGRQYKEDGNVANMANLVEEIGDDLESINDKLSNDTINNKVADGDDVALGAKADAAATIADATPFSVIALLKGLFNKLAGVLNVQISGSNPIVAEATIANGASLSGVVDIDMKSVWGIIMPSAWTAAMLTFQVSDDNVNYGDLYYDGLAFSVSEAIAGIGITLNPLVFSPWKYLKVRSGTTEVVVNQGAERVITLLIKDM